MKLYFQANKNRIAIDTDNKVYCIDYFFLGGYRSYIKISTSDYKELIEKCNNEYYEINWYA